MGERKGEPCRRLVRLNSRRSGQTGSWKSDFYVQARQSYSWRAGWHKRCALHSLACLRERAGVRAAFTPSPAGGRRGWGRCCFLFGRCAWFEAGGRVSARQPSSFSLPRQKKWGKEKASLAGGFPAELPSLLRRSGQTGSRKSDFLCPSTPVLQLACGVAQALCLALPRLLAGEGRYRER